MKRSQIILFSILLISILLNVSCSNLKSLVSEPKFRAQSCEISNISFDKIDLLFKVRIDNPNAFSIPFPNVDWNLSVNSSKFLQNKLTKNASIAANGYTMVDIPISVAFVDLYNVVKSLINTDEASYLMNVGFYIPLPVLENHRFEVNFNGKIPTLKEPKLSFKEIKVNSLKLDKIDLSVVCEVENKNNFAFLLNNINYALNINNVEWASGGAASNKNITANNKLEIPFNVSVNSLNVISEITQIILGNKPVNYSWSGNINLKTDNQLIKNISLPFNLSGNTIVKK